jgi:hypothetical protein
VYSSNSMVGGHAIVNTFLLALYDHHKCTTSPVKVHAKQDVLTCPPHHLQNTSKLWNYSCHTSAIFAVRTLRLNAKIT